MLSFARPGGEDVTALRSFIEHAGCSLVFSFCAAVAACMPFNYKLRQL